MKKILRTVAIVLAVVIAIPVILAAVFMFMMKDMRAGENTRINDAVFCIKGVRVNCYAVASSTGYILVDAGDNVKAVSASLAVLRIDPESVRAVFLTHSDADHTAALPLFPKARVYISREENDLLTGAKLRHILFISRTNTLPVAAYTLVTNGESIAVGNTVVWGMHTPGHTPGSYSYLVNGRSLFTGDAVIIKKGRMTPMGKPFTEDVERNAVAVDGLRSLPGIAVLGTAHTGYTTDWEYARGASVR